jgi:hypothetical protein
MPIDTTTTNLAGFDFSQRADKAALKGQSLAFHRLAGANLGTLDLTGTNFSGADLTGAVFEGAKLDKADFTNALVTLDQIEQAKSYKDAIAPNGVVIESMEQIREEYAKGTPEAAQSASEREATLLKQLKEMQDKLAEQAKIIEAAREAERLKKPEPRR